MSYLQAMTNGIEMAFITWIIVVIVGLVFAKLLTNSKESGDSALSRLVTTAVLIISFVVVGMVMVGII